MSNGDAVAAAEPTFLVIYLSFNYCVRAHRVCAFFGIGRFAIYVLIDRRVTHIRINYVIRIEFSFMHRHRSSMRCGDGSL